MVNLYLPLHDEKWDKMTNAQYVRLTPKYIETMAHGGITQERLQVLENKIEDGSLLFVTSDQKRELEYILEQSFNRNGMNAVEVAKDLTIAGYGKIIQILCEGNKISRKYEQLRCDYTASRLEVLKLQIEMEELKNANSKRN